MSKNQFTGTATQLQRNRKFCQFNKDQYCIRIQLLKVTGGLPWTLAKNLFRAKVGFGPRFYLFIYLFMCCARTGKTDTF